jgi:protoheme IX farnesyltransferase
MPDIAMVSAGSSDRIRDLLDLTKPRLSCLVLITAAGGLWLSQTPVHWTIGLAAVLGTTLVVGGANALNCYLERDIDKRMARTSLRPLPSGRMEPSTALIFGLTLSLLSVPLLTLLTTPLAGLLAALALLLYVLVYTPMKRYSAISTLIGAVPGAMPPLIGWTAATGTLDTGGLMLFFLLFLWQIPHSLAISIFRQQEYAAAGLWVFSNDYGLDSTRAHIFLYTVPLVALPLVLWELGIASWATLVSGGVLGLWMLWQAASGWLGKKGPVWARKLFFTTLIYLSVLFATLTIDQWLSVR